MNSIDIGKKLQCLRGGITRNEVANACGISVSALAMYEIGERIPRDEIKIRLAKYYKSTVEEIFFTNNVHEM